MNATDAPGKITDSRATVFASMMGELKAVYENEPRLKMGGGVWGRGVREEWIMRMLTFAGYTHD
uniref:Uncharacterized protein n=1 Tax=viral metagenome TaxID=1070528 RepID=A0A6M3K922_9ZZZZ